MPEGPFDPKEMGRLYALGQVGMEMVVPVLIGLALDHWLGWGPWATVTGAVLGFVVGMLHLIHLLGQDGDSNSSRKKRENQ